MSATGYKADPKDATPDECVIYDLWHDLGFCGCANPEAVLSLMRDELRRMKGDRRRDLSNDPYRLLLDYVLDAAGLTEHGGAVDYSWLTEKGEQVLASMERAGDFLAFVERWGEIGVVPR